MTSETPIPTGRELEILEILWAHGEATVREVYEVMREENPIVQNTVQAFLRTMTEKGLVVYRKEGRSFVYRALVQQKKTKKRLLKHMLDRVFEGSLESLVTSALQLKKPRKEEIRELRRMLEEMEAKAAKEKS